MASTSLTITLPPELADDLRAAADACEMTVDAFTKQVLEREAHLAAEALGWNRSIEDDLAAVSDYEETGEAIPSEDVFAWLKSLHTENPLPRPRARKLD